MTAMASALKVAVRQSTGILGGKCCEVFFDSMEIGCSWSQLERDSASHMSQPSSTRPQPCHLIFYDSLVKTDENQLVHDDDYQTALNSCLCVDMLFQCSKDTTHRLSYFDSSKANVHHDCHVLIVFHIKTSRFHA